MRRHDIDILRIASAFGIVWFHADAPGRSAGYSGLVVFLILSSYFAVQSDRPKPPRERFRRYMIPYALWSVPYGLINYLKHGSFTPADRGVFATIISGTNLHLWYLPFVFGMLLVIDGAKRIIRPSQLGILFAVLCILDLASATFWYPRAIAQGAPTAQFAHAFYGIAVGGFLGSGRTMRPLLRTVCWVAVYVLLAGTWIAQLRIAVPYTFGTLAVHLVLVSGKSRVHAKWIPVVADCMLGVYLMHPIVLKASSLVIAIPGLQAVSAFAVSLAAVAFMRMKFRAIASYVV